MRLYRESFDPSNSLVARKPFTCQGVSYTPGQAFDVDVPERRRRQMYDCRMLAAAGSTEAVKAAAAYERAEAARLTKEEPVGMRSLRDSLTVSRAEAPQQLRYGRRHGLVGRWYSRIPSSCRR